MRIFRAQDRRLHAPSKPAAEPITEARVPTWQARRAWHYPLNWQTAREAIARSRAMLEQTKKLPGVRDSAAMKKPCGDARQPSLERLLALRQSCASVQRASDLALLRAERAFQRSSMLIAQAARLRDRIGRKNVSARASALEH